MNTDQFLPDAGIVATIEKDIAIYNQRREAEHRVLERREPAVTMAYAVVVAFVAYVGYRVFSHSNAWYMAPMFVGALGFGFWPHVRNWARRDAEWTQQNFRDHIVPVMLGFVPDLRYRHGSRPRAFDRIPKALLPPHNRSTFDDVISATLDGRRFELFEAKLVQKGKNSEQVMFEGAILHCRRGEAFRGVLVATRRTGEFRRFLRDLFDSSGLGEVAVTSHGLGQLYEFRTDNRGAASKLLAGGAADLLLAISGLWRGQTPQIAFSFEDVFVLLPSKQNFFELPAIERGVSYRGHIEPMARQFASFLAIVREVGKLDGPVEVVNAPAAASADVVGEAGETGKLSAAPDEKPFVPLLDAVPQPEEDK